MQRNQPLGDVVQLVHRGNSADDVPGEVIHQDDLLRGQRHVGRDVNLTGLIDNRPDERQERAGADALVQQIDQPPRARGQALGADDVSLWCNL